MQTQPFSDQAKHRPIVAASWWQRPRGPRRPAGTGRAWHRRSRAGAVLFALWPASAVAQPPTPGNAPPAPADPDARFVIKRFDFDERKLGNNERVPRFWRAVEGLDFPRFTEPQFDEGVGRTAPPSFRFALRGGDVGARYVAKDIPVSPGSEYRVTAWIRSSGLARAEAYLAAHYLDHRLRTIAGSERRTVGVRDDAGGEEWTQVTLMLPAAEESARWMGLACFVEHPGPPGGAAAEPRPIRRQDVRGAAWFDDITVMRLPAASLEVAGEGGNGWFVGGAPIECRTHVTSVGGAALATTLTIHDAAGRLVQTARIAARGRDEPPTTVVLRDLPAGSYRARLRVVDRASNEVLVERRRPLVVLASPGRTDDGRPSRLGLSTRPQDAGDSSRIAALAAAVSAGYVKAPVWRLEADGDAVVFGDAPLDGLVRALHGSPTAFVAVVEAPPQALSERLGRGHESLLDVLSRDPRDWRSWLALPLARLGPAVRHWQIGADDADVWIDERLSGAVSAIDDEIRQLVEGATIIVPRAVRHGAVDSPTPASVGGVTVPAHVTSAELAEYLGDALRGETRHWITLAPPVPDRYSDRRRLIEYARRLVLALETEAEAVFVPQPFVHGTSEGDAQVQTNEDLVCLAGLSNLLATRRPVGPVWIDHGVHAWLFESVEKDAGALVAWTVGEESPARWARLAAGPRVRQFDLLGNRLALFVHGGEAAFELDAAPTILTPVSMCRVRMQTAFTLDNPVFAPSFVEQYRRLRLTNTRDVLLRGVLTLRPPAGWRVRPSRVPIDLTPGQPTELELAVKAPSNQSAGDFELAADFAPEDENDERITLRTPLHVRTDGLDVNVLTRTDGPDLVIVHRVTNRTDEALNLRTAVVASDGRRRVRRLGRVAPGETVMREYVIDDADRLPGDLLRVSVEQIDGPLMAHQLIQMN